MKKLFDPTKPVQTRDGRKARILTADLKNRSDTIAAVIEPEAIHMPEEIHTYYPSGQFMSTAEFRLDLVNVPPPTERRTVWINVLPHEVYVYDRQEDANRNASSNRIACVETTIEFVPGETGL